MLRALTLAFTICAATALAQTTDLPPAEFSGELLTADGEIVEIEGLTEIELIYGLTVPPTATGFANVNVQNSLYSLYETKAQQLRFRVRSDLETILADAMADAEAAGFVPGDDPNYSASNDDSIGRFAFVADTADGEARYYFQYQTRGQDKIDIIMTIVTPFKVDL